MPALFLIATSWELVGKVNPVSQQLTTGCGEQVEQCAQCWLEQQGGAATIWGVSPKWRREEFSIITSLRELNISLNKTAVLWGKSGRGGDNNLTALSKVWHWCVRQLASFSAVWSCDPDNPCIPSRTVCRIPSESCINAKFNVIQDWDWNLSPVNTIGTQNLWMSLELRAWKWDWKVNPVNGLATQARWTGFELESMNEFGTWPSE